MSYLDTCYIVAFIDERDKLRKDICRDIRKYRSSKSYYVSMPAIGEAIMVITRNAKKDPDPKGRLMTAFNELINLLVGGYFVIKDGNNNNNGTVFELAKNLQSCNGSAPRDKVTFMDALITAIAVLDEDCQGLCTTDSRLLMNDNVYNIVMSERNKHTIKEFRIQELH